LEKEKTRKERDQTVEDGNHSKLGETNKGRSSEEEAR
jgi:hypothetical protein